MSDLKPIAPLKFASAIMPAINRGERGALEWIEIGKLFIDPAYQREVLDDGRRNVRNIAENFRWAYFTPLVVSPRPGGYAIIDGQHRAVAAKTHGGIDALPCLVVHCTREEEARAFAVINGNITRPNNLQIYAARLAAGDAKAQALKAVCDEGGVRVPRNIKLCDKPGDTLAIGALERCLDQYGAKILTLALNLITETGGGQCRAGARGDHPCALPGAQNACAVAGKPCAAARHYRKRDARQDLQDRAAGARRRRRRDESDPCRKNRQRDRTRSHRARESTQGGVT